MSILAMIKVDLRNTAWLARDLKNLRKSALPYAQKNAVNEAAFEGRKLWQEELQSSFTLRNKFTERSIRVDKARSLHNPEAKLGSVASYMDEQEEGTTLTKTSKHGIPIPTAASSGEGKAKIRKRVVRRANRLTNIKFSSRIGNSPKQKNAIAISQAIRTKTKFAFLETSRRKGIFRVTGRLKNPKITMLHDLTRSSVRIPSTPTLSRTLDRLDTRMDGIYRKALLFQLSRHTGLKARRA